VYIRSKEGPAKVLNDLAEICKGVQHPVPPGPPFTPTSPDQPRQAARTWAHHMKGEESTPPSPMQAVPNVTSARFSVAQPTGNRGRSLSMFPECPFTFLLLTDPALIVRCCSLGWLLGGLWVWLQRGWVCKRCRGVPGAQLHRDEQALGAHAAPGACLPACRPLLALLVPFSSLPLVRSKRHTSGIAQAMRLHRTVEAELQRACQGH